MGRSAHDWAPAPPNTGSAVNDLRTLFEQIDDLMAESADVDLARFERTLTDGYARALALEGERLRLSKRINELAASLAEGGVEAKTEEIASAVERLEESGSDLSALRRALAGLRDRAEAARAAAATL